MFRYRRLLLIFLLFNFHLALSQQSDPISEEFVSRILKKLSSDDMRGRDAFTPYADSAANFLASEFEVLGLDPLPGEDNYLQRFSIFSLQKDSSALSLNGKAVDKVQYFYRSSSPSFEFKPSTPYQTITVGKGDDVRTQIRKALRAKEDQIVLLDTSHAQLFERYRGFLNRNQYHFSLNDGPSSLFILCDIPETIKIDFYARQLVDTTYLSNVGAMIPGKRANEYVIFSGHYDHIGVGKAVEGDSIYNGANDDATGTTAMMSLAKYFSQQAQPERSLLFVGFTAEERGGYGSRYFSQQLAPEDVIAMFNIEMIGLVSEEGPSSAWITGYEYTDFGEIIKKGLVNTAYNFYPDPYPQQNLFYRSDNATLARLGVPAHTFSTTPMGTPVGMEHYHQPSDEFETMDIAHITDIIRGIQLASMPIVSGAYTPSRVDTSKID